MRGSLMLGMVPGMLDGLCLSQSADGKDAEHEEDRHEFEDGVVHQKTTLCDWPNVNGRPLGLSSRWVVGYFDFHAINSFSSQILFCNASG
jgi:hypothetical protein